MRVYILYSFSVVLQAHHICYQRDKCSNLLKKKSDMNMICCIEAVANKCKAVSHIKKMPLSVAVQL